ncbi:carboxypeptidase B [Penaeus vannamei]|uniref:carboxypeptidase B n=1 Tax=Penaeus vannamei TaxID=6689 RepID=UPI00387F5AD1
MKLWQGIAVLVLVPGVLSRENTRNEAASSSSSHNTVSTSHSAASTSHSAASTSHSTSPVNYLGWDIFDVQSIAPFFNLENYGFPSHIDLLSFNTGTGTTVLAVAEDKLTKFMDKLTNAGVGFQNTLNDISQLFLTPLKYDQTRSLRKGDATFERYMSYEEIVSYIEELPAQYPEDVQVEEIGRSVEDRPIYQVIINRNDSASTDKPVIFIEAGIYAREWVSPASALYLVNRLLQDSPSLSQEAEWRLVPLLNPDGYVYSWRHDRLWKKNRASTSDSDCSGVDLNKNFGFYWGEIGSSINPCSNMFQGPVPFSEPETKALRDAVYQVQNRTKAYISLHSFGQTFSYTRNLRSDVNRTSDEELERIAEGMRDRIQATSGAEYTVTRTPESIIVGGTSENWVASLGVPYVYTMELRDRGETVFHLPEDLIDEAGEDAWAAMKYLSAELEE